MFGYPKYELPSPSRASRRSWRTLFILALICILQALAGSASAAPSDEVAPLWLAATTEAETGRVAAEARAQGDEAWPVEIDASVLAANPERLSLELEGETWTAVREHWLVNSHDRAVWSGRLEGGAFPAGSHWAIDYVILSYIEGRVVGSLRTPDGQAYKLRRDEAGQYRLRKVRPSQARPAGAPTCGLESSERVQGEDFPGILGESDATSGAIGFRADQSTTPDCSIPSQGVVIDLAGLYLNTVVGAGTQGLHDDIQHLVDEANVLNQNSQIKVTYNLIHTGPLNNPGILPGMAVTDAVDELAQRNVPAFEALREEYGADMVSLMVPADTSNYYCGAAVVPVDDNGAEKIYSLPELFVDQAYMVYEQGCGSDDFTFAHEHGHNYGMQHETSSKPIYDFAHAYVFGDALGNTAMGCATVSGGPGITGVCDRVAYFSNPNLTWSNTGDVLGESQTAFNTCVANLRRQRYADFRQGLSPAAPVVYVDNPSQYEQLFGTQTLHGWATDASGVESLTFQIDGQPANQITNLVKNTTRSDVCSSYDHLMDPNCPNVGWQGQLDTTTLSNGYHTLKVIATDALGTTKTYSRGFYVSNITTTSFAPLADATVYEKWYWYNYGTSQTLAVRGSGSGQAAHTYLKFSVSGVNFPIQSAKLRLRTRAYAIPQVNVWHMSSNSWTETGITWSNASIATNSGPITKYSLPAYTWVDIDITPFITANGTYTFGMASVDAYGYWFSSRETSYPPSLVITY